MPSSPPLSETVFEVSERVRISDMSSRYYDQLGEIVRKDEETGWHYVRIDGFPANFSKAFKDDQIQWTTLTTPLEY
jgi:hypothetical protein